MCIISDSVKYVAATKIFSMPSLDGTRQLTVYTNSVDTPRTNVMCLPVPAPATVKFEKVPKNIFNQCASSITAVYNEKEFKKLKLSARSASTYLAVQSHGSYDVVIVPSMAELDRIPPSFATLTPEVIQFLRKNYPSKYGVVLCRLRAGFVDYEPFAYSHALVGGKLFLPTKHYHKHQAYHAVWGDGTPMYTNKHIQSLRNDTDWDHNIYTIMTDPTTAHNVGPKIIPKEENEIVWTEMPSDFRVGSNAQVQLFEAKGQQHPKRRFNICRKSATQTNYLDQAQTNVFAIQQRLNHQLKVWL